MLQHSLKAGLIAVALALVAQDANAFGHRWGGCGWGGYGYGYGGCGYGGWYAGYGGYPGYGYGYGGYASCGYGGCATAPAGAPLNGAAPATAPKPGMGAPAPGTTSSYELRPDSLMIAVNLPADAKVTINGRPTTSTGKHRTYVSSNVLVNSSYHYVLRVDFTRDGKPVTEEKSVDLSAGKTASLTFGVPTAQVADISTSAQR